MDSRARRPLAAGSAHPRGRVDLRRRTTARGRFVRGAALIGILAGLAAPAQALQGETRQPEALQCYEQWRPAALAGTLPEGVACELFGAVEALYGARSEQVEPRELLRVAVAAAAGCPEDGLALLRAVDWSTRFLRGSGDPEGALGLLEADLPALVERFPGHATTLFLEFNLLQLLREQNRWRAALELADALQPRLLASDSRALFESTLYGERASLYLAWGLTDLAWRWHARQRAALTGASANARRHADLVEANLLLAETDDAQQNRRAEARVLELLADAGLYPPDIPARGRLLIRAALARLGAAEGDPRTASRARELLDEALAIPSLEPYERRRAQLALAEIALCESALEAVESALQQALDPAAGALPPVLSAMGATLRSRLARRRGERTGLVAARDELERSFRGFLEDWRRLPLREGGFGFFLFRENQRIVGERIEVELALDDGPDGVARAFEVVLRAQASSSLARAIGGESVPGLGELRAALLRPEEGFLILVPAPERCHMFALDASALTHHPLPPLGEIGSAHERFLRHFLVPPPAGPERRTLEDERRGELAALSRAMLPPSVRPRIAAWTALTWVGTDNLSALPCEELPLDDGRALGATRAVGYVDSLATALGLERRRARRMLDEPPGSGASWLVACPDPGPEMRAELGLAVLPFAERDARAFLDPLPDPHHLRFGPRAEPDALSGAGRERARYLAIVAHGARAPEEERPARILLQGGVARCGDIEALSAPALVTLLACSTQAGPGRIGDPGAADLGGAFLRAGADSVLLSPFPIDFHTARALCAAFHGQLARGAVPAEALRAARVEIERAGLDPRLAPLRLVGLAQRPVFEARPIRGLSALWIGVGLGAVALWTLARRRRDSSVQD